MNTKNPVSKCTSCRSKVFISPYAVIALSGSAGIISLILFGIFLYTGLPNQMDFGLDEKTNFYIDSLLCFLFFFQHSLMIRRGFRHWLSGFISPNYYGAFFSIFSGLSLLILMLFWQKSTSLQVEFDGFTYWLMRALFFVAIVGFYFGIRSLRPLDPFGIREIFRHLKSKPAKESFFILRGPYQWVRHPLYFFCLLMIWSQVSLTMDRLLFNGLFTFWIIIGAFLEERDLIASFGDAYRNYQRKVPMLIPYRWLPWNNNQK
jgi:methanethiol S-methyltransferase